MRKSRSAHGEGRRGCVIVEYLEVQRLQVRSPLMAASATFALKVGVWFRRGRLFMVSPDSLGTACPLSGRNSTYRPVQISETSSGYVEFNRRSHVQARSAT